MQAKQHNSQLTRVILVRHGRSSYNELQLYQGSCDDSLLTEKGYQQAYQTGLFLSDTNIDTVYCSPLQRTQASAKAILSAIKSKSVNNSAPLQLHSNLKEVDLPGWEGLSFKYVREKLSEEYRIWKEEPHKFRMETLHVEESLSAEYPAPTSTIKSKIKYSYPVLELYEKARQFWQEVLPLHPGKTILIVSHGGTIRALINTAIGIDESGFHRFQQSNCGVSMLTFFDDTASVTQLDAMNLTQHTEEIIPKLKEGKLGLRLAFLPVESYANLAIDNLANHFKQISIDFCLSTNFIDTKTLLKLQPNPTVNIQVERQDFIRVWHKAILERNLNFADLTTGLIIAEKTAIQSGINQIFGLSANAESLNLQTAKITIIHYPVGVKEPILQAMNI